MPNFNPGLLGLLVVTVVMPCMVGFLVWLGRYTDPYEVEKRRLKKAERNSAGIHFSGL